jgi:hypothetical protein
METAAPTHKSYDRLNFLWMADLSFDEILKFVTSTIAERNTCVK